MNTDDELPPAVIAMSQWARTFSTDIGHVKDALQAGVDACSRSERIEADRAAFDALTRLLQQLRSHWTLPTDGYTSRPSRGALEEIEPLWRLVGETRYEVHRRLVHAGVHPAGGAWAGGAYHGPSLGDRPPL